MRSATLGGGARLRYRTARLPAALGPIAILLANAPAAGGQSAQAPWSSSSEFSFVQTGGNAESATFGVATTVTRAWERTEVKIEAGGIRTRSTRYSRIAVGTETDFRVDETSDSDISAENYNARMRVDRRFSDRTSVFVQSGWTRNTFSGIRHRLVNVLGVSTRWTATETQRIRTAYGFTHTIQQDVVPDPERDNRFLGLRLSTEYWRKVTGNAEWTSNLVMDGNGDDPSDLRADWTNALSVSMNEHLGLKTSFRTTFDNEPALARVPLVSAGGEETGSVLIPRKEFDRVFTVALVVSF